MGAASLARGDIGIGQRSLDRGDIWILSLIEPIIGFTLLVVAGDAPDSGLMSDVNGGLPADTGVIAGFSDK